MIAQQITAAPKYSKSYKTRDTAIAKVETFLNKLNELDRVRYVLTVNEDGRFAPIVFLTQNQTHMALPIVNAGFTVVA